MFTLKEMKKKNFLFAQNSILQKLFIVKLEVLTVILLKIKLVRLNINQSRQHIKKRWLLKYFTVSFETGAQTVNSKWITTLVNLFWTSVIIISNYIHKETDAMVWSAWHIYH